jgi:hypothetical protein
MKSVAALVHMTPPPISGVALNVVAGFCGKRRYVIYTCAGKRFNNVTIEHRKNISKGACVRLKSFHRPRRRWTNLTFIHALLIKTTPIIEQAITLDVL